MNPSRLIISARSGLSAIVLGLLFVMAACSGGGSNNVSDPPTLVSVQVAAPSINLTVGDSEQLIDGSGKLALALFIQDFLAFDLGVYFIQAYIRFTGDGKQLADGSSELVLVQDLRALWRIDSRMRRRLVCGRHSCW